MQSMTGFGAATRETEFGRIGAEARSVNNRFLELGFRLGQTFIHLEVPLRSELRQKIARGKVDITLRFEPADTVVPDVRINAHLLKSLARQLDEAGLSGSGDFRTEAFLQVPGVLITGSDTGGNEKLDALVCEIVHEAVERLVEERAREGAALREACLGHHDRMRALLDQVERSRDEVVEKYRVRLHERIEELMNAQKAALDPGRLEQEVAIFADKADISEECARLSAHLDALRGLADESDAVGRRLDFLVQEILREVNTIGSKCRDLDLARCVLDLKKETESLREQIANVE